jgi:hypothetical protein
MENYGNFAKPKKFFAKVIFFMKFPSGKEMKLLNINKINSLNIVYHAKLISFQKPRVNYYLFPKSLDSFI